MPPLGVLHGIIVIGDVGISDQIIVKGVILIIVIVSVLIMQVMDMPSIVLKVVVNNTRNPVLCEEMQVQ
jgi:hypothetical protein